MREYFLLQSYEHFACLEYDLFLVCKFISFPTSQPLICEKEEDEVLTDDNEYKKPICCKERGGNQKGDLEK